MKSRTAVTIVVLVALSFIVPTSVYSNQEAIKGGGGGGFMLGLNTGLI